MSDFQNVIIGFGKGGKTLAAKLAAKGQKTVIIEASPLMYGGTCINKACIPTKSLETNSKFSLKVAGSFKEKSFRYEKAIEEKDNLTSMLRGKNYDKAISSNVQVITAVASFEDATHIKLAYPDGKNEVISGDNFFINIGSFPRIPNIMGLKESKHVYTSETLMVQKKLPKKLVIIGGGYIGLEFASFYTNFGSEVTIIQDNDVFIPREDREIANAVEESFKKRNITIIKNAKIEKIVDTVSKNDSSANVVLSMSVENQNIDIASDAILVATGRVSDFSILKPENAGISLNERGGLIVNEYLQTNVPSIFAMGDAAGSLQFTYISLDDSRIVYSKLCEDGKRTTQNRGEVPYSVFIDPPLSRIGLTEDEAIKKGFSIKVGKIPAASIPKAHILHQPTGILKVIVDAKTDLILGAHLFCVESHEVINIIKLAMDLKSPYTILKNSIFTHPTMSESLNDLFSSIK